MEKLFQQIFYDQSIRILDDSGRTNLFNRPYSAISSFAIEDSIATAVGKGKAPMSVRFWVHERTLVLGIPDARLPYLEDGVRYVRSLGYNVIVRNSGGLAVLLDRNVLNVSLILPSSRNLSIHDGYDLMYTLVQQLLEREETHVQAYEIVGSYCPGDYDLSINGKKFAGISQRRVREGISVQMYLDVAGSSYERAKLVKQFYTHAKRNEPTRFSYPKVNPHVMASLSELLQKEFSVQEMKDRFVHLLVRHGAKVRTDSYTPTEEVLFHNRIMQMEKRNEVLRF
ncbi:MAG TPA: lipoate--protein ligase family protein [Pseudogracilibacillus sp.]|nr:lipoate--protein ligase family protein [Pseudogracilibacillus sp.]